MSFEFEDSHLQQITEYAEIGFSWREIATTLRIHKKTFFLEWDNPNSLVREAYDAGVLQTKASVEAKRTDYAIDGNITAMQMLDKRDEQRTFSDLKDKFFNHG
ncbi:hypothetical protein [Nonlabens dokdonensis]|uniref:hypothetical protein n=1 Tax=Nonlabens dokdonensis TaxID=328515 RepID=UPI0026F1EF52|nr:hypothetical protein [Nonlabens dokdonensis]